MEHGKLRRNLRYVMILLVLMLLPLAEFYRVHIGISLGTEIGYYDKLFGLTRTHLLPWYLMLGALAGVREFTRVRELLAGKEGRGQGIIRGWYLGFQVLLLFVTAILYAVMSVYNMTHSGWYDGYIGPGRDVNDLVAPLFTVLLLAEYLQLSWPQIRKAWDPTLPLYAKVLVPGKTLLLRGISQAKTMTAKAVFGVEFFVVGWYLTRTAWDLLMEFFFHGDYRMYDSLVSATYWGYYGHLTGFVVLVLLWLVFLEKDET